jgi:hypothetical protein
MVEQRQRVLHRAADVAADLDELVLLVEAGDQEITLAELDVADIAAFDLGRELLGVEAGARDSMLDRRHRA